MPPGRQKKAVFTSSFPLRTPASTNPCLRALKNEHVAYCSSFKYGCFRVFCSTTFPVCSSFSPTKIKIPIESGEDVSVHSYRPRTIVKTPLKLDVCGEEIILRAQRERNQIYRFERTPFLHRHHHQYRTYRSLFRRRQPSHRHGIHQPWTYARPRRASQKRPDLLASSLLASYCFSPRPIRLDPRYTAPRPFASTTRTRSRLPRRWRHRCPVLPSAIIDSGALTCCCCCCCRRRPLRRPYPGRRRWWFCRRRAVALRRFFSIGQRW